MLTANSSRDINHAARAAAKYLRDEHGIELSHAKAQDLVARTLGKPHHMAAQASLAEAVETVPLSAARDVIEDLCKVLTNADVDRALHEEGISDAAYAALAAAVPYVRASVRGTFPRDALRQALDDVRPADAQSKLANGLRALVQADGGRGKFIVTYMEYVAIGNQPFECEADNEDDARLQCRKAHPDAEIHKVERAPAYNQAQAVAFDAMAMRQRWLRWTEAALRFNGVREADLANLVNRVRIGLGEVSATGIYGQLEALLEAEAHHGGCDAPRCRRNVAKMLMDAFPKLHLPVLGFDVIDLPLIHARATICRGSDFEVQMTFDALEWFAAATASDIEALRSAGLRDTPESAQVLQWLAANSMDDDVREDLQALLERLGDARRANSQLAGLEVAIGERDVAIFVKAMQLK